jgi:putative transcriptional regulator
MARKAAAVGPKAVGPKASPARRGRAPAARNVAEDLVQSMREAVAIARGEMDPARVHRVAVERDEVDVRAIRGRLGLSQEAFARRFRFSVASVREWEQGRRRPEAAARTLLRVIAHNPQAVTEALDAPDAA